jgi:hypothetical protein
MAMICGYRQPFGECFSWLGVVTPPCCAIDEEQKSLVSVAKPESGAPSKKTMTRETVDI